MSWHSGDKADKRGEWTDFVSSVGIRSYFEWKNCQNKANDNVDGIVKMCWNENEIASNGHEPGDDLC